MYKRHDWFYLLLRPLVALFLFFRFGYRYEKTNGLPGPTLILSNHVTDWDPLFVGASFSNPMYFVASEHIARWKNAFKFIDYIFAPIMRYKGSVALSTVREVLRRVKPRNARRLSAVWNVRELPSPMKASLPWLAVQALLSFTLPFFWSRSPAFSW